MVQLYIVWCDVIMVSFLMSQNSIRHNLSLNASFCKAERPDGLQTKKGCYWMINPERLHVVESEIEKFLRTDGRSLVENGEQQPCSSACPPACEFFIHHHHIVVTC